MRMRKVCSASLEQPAPWLIPASIIVGGKRELTWVELGVSLVRPRSRLAMGSIMEFTRRVWWLLIIWVVKCLEWIVESDSTLWSIQPHFVQLVSHNNPIVFQKIIVAYTPKNRILTVINTNTCQPKRQRVILRCLDLRITGRMLGSTLVDFMIKRCEMGKW